jgi:hypothetical protein
MNTKPMVVCPPSHRRKLWSEHAADAGLLVAATTSVIAAALKLISLA